MAVYVDDALLPYTTPVLRRRMLMCHMTADTHEELVAMADRIGVSRRWIRREGEPGEHFDICRSKRALAVAAGAIEQSQMTTARRLFGRH